MSNGVTKFDFSDITKPIPPGMRSGAAADDKSSKGFDFGDISSPFTANVKGEGVYSMTAPSGESVKVPYSKVVSAGTTGYKLDPKDYSHFLEHYHYGHRTEKTPAGPTPESVFAAPVGSAEWGKQRGYGALRSMEDLLPTAGAIAGGAATAVPGAVTGPGDIFIAAGGAAAGAALGEMARQAIDDVVFHETLAPSDVAIHVGEQALGGALAEVGGRALGVPLTKGAQWFGDTAQKAIQAGYRMLPTEARGMSQSFLERYANASLLSSGWMAKWRELQNKETAAAVDNLANTISNFKGSNNALGKLVQGGIDNYRAGFKKWQEQVYGDIDRRVVGSGALPSRQSIVDIAKKELADIAESRQAGGVTPTPSKLEGILKGITENPATTATYKGMSKARSEWLDMARSVTEPLSNAEKGLLKKMAGAADQSMIDAASEAARRGNPGLVNAVRNANLTTRQTHEMFEHNLMKKIASAKSPSVIARTLSLQSTSPEETQTLMRVLTSARDKEAVQAHLIRDAFTKATPDPGAKIAFDEKGFSRNILRLGEDKGQAIFGNNWATIKEVATRLGHISGQGASRRGGAAELANPAMVKELIVQVGSLLAGMGTGHLGTFAVGVGAEAAGMNAFAYGLRNPATAASILRGLQVAARTGPYLTQGTINMILGSIRRDAQLEAQRQAAERAATGPESAAPSAALRPESAQSPAVPLNPPNKEYQVHAQNPQGHEIGTNDGGETWYDVQTGQRVQ